MPTYIALLRSVNVGGRSVSMAKVRKLFEDAGYANVRTYIQTGNVLFEAKESDRSKLTASIEKMLKAGTKLDIHVLIYTADELKKAAAKNPFEPEKFNDKQRCHLLFLSAAPDAAHRKKLMDMAGEEYRFKVVGRVLYYAYDNVFAGKRRNIPFDKVLGVYGTSRAWNVVNKLIELAQK